VLALEAEVLKNDSNSDAWHLLGVAHGERRRPPGKHRKGPHIMSETNCR